MKIINTDLLIIGGGINGSGVAVDAIGKGLSVVLCEAKDFAGGTSGSSSKLVHGGLRYLEQYEFKLVKESLKERDVLLNKAPHLVQPLKFILPHAKHLRPQCVIRIGLFLYDFLAGKMNLDKSGKIDLLKTVYGKNIKKEYKKAFSYSDCRIDDARMVISNVLEAQKLGAEILPRTKCISSKRCGDFWISKLLNSKDEILEVKSKAIVNAAGPWVANVIQETLDGNSKSAINMVKGSHFIIPKLYKGNHAYILQNKDNRIVFALPYGFVGKDENEFTLIGTTDLNFQGNPRDIKISENEIEYLCNLINEYFDKKTTAEDLIWSYAGVRALYDDGEKNPSKVTREYHLELSDENNKLPVLSVFGGKLTTYRVLSEKIVNKLSKYFPNLGANWTSSSKIIGGEAKNQQEIINNITKKYPFLNEKQIYRYSITYGTRAFDMLQDSKSISDLGLDFGCNLYEKEVIYLCKNEWVFSAEDILKRRTKLVLWFSKEQTANLDSWIKANLNKIISNNGENNHE